VHAGATACIAFNDLIAIGMLTRLRERGVRVPEDMSVVGCDDIFGADFCNPPLTTMTSPIERAGRVAVSMLLAELGGLPADHSGERIGDTAVLPTHLTVRGSTGPAPTDRSRR
jgi:LacI family transcriptional regulator